MAHETVVQRPKEELSVVEDMRESISPTMVKVRILLHIVSIVYRYHDN